MKGAYLLAGMKLGVLFRLLCRRGVSIGIRYLVRLLFLLQGSFWSSVFSFFEKKKEGVRIENAKTPDNPIFIVGHWRTGSTLLHQLMSRDPNLAAPNLFQCSFPDSFLSSRKYVAPIFGPMTRGPRPMDNVIVGIDEPQEDEFALARMTGHSPLVDLAFPRSKEYFLLDDEIFLPPAEEMEQWERSLVTFMKKLEIQYGRRVVLKNPCHSMRIPTLLRLFPEATFIHIYRNPLAVIPSTIHMWSIVGEQNTMRKEWRPPSLEDVITVFDRMLSRVRSDLSLLPEDRIAEICFEDFEKDPVACLKAVYRKLGLDFSETYEERITGFLEETAGYQKNAHVLSREHEELIRSRLAAHMARDGY